MFCGYMVFFLLNNHMILKHIGYTKKLTAARRPLEILSKANDSQVIISPRYSDHPIVQEVALVPRRTKCSTAMKVRRKALPPFPVLSCSDPHQFSPTASMAWPPSGKFSRSPLAIHSLKRAGSSPPLGQNPMPTKSRVKRF
jgi:hypothetical protein